MLILLLFAVWSTLEALPPDIMFFIAPSSLSPFSALHAFFHPPPPPFSSLSASPLPPSLRANKGICTTALLNVSGADSRPEAGVPRCRRETGVQPFLAHSCHAFCLFWYLLSAKVGSQQSIRADSGRHQQSNVPKCKLLLCGYGVVLFRASCRGVAPPTNVFESGLQIQSVA